MAMRAKQGYQFGAFRLDPTDRLLLRPWLIDSKPPLCSEIAATIRKAGSAKATSRPPREEPHSLATSSLAIRLQRLCRVYLILTRTSFAAERIQIEFARTTSTVPCQLNSRASTATALDSDAVTRAHGSAQGKSSTRTPHRGHSTRRGR